MQSRSSIALSLILLLCVFGELEGRSAGYPPGKVGWLLAADLSWCRKWVLQWDGSVFGTGVVVFISCLSLTKHYETQLGLVLASCEVSKNLLWALAAGLGPCLPPEMVVCFLFLANREDFDSLHFKSAGAAGYLQSIPQILKLFSFLVSLFLTKWLGKSCEWVPRHLHWWYWQRVFSVGKGKCSSVDSNTRVLSYNFQLAGFVSEGCLDLYFINLK